jgi:hypothetical protein
MEADKQFRNWWTDRMGRPSIPKGFVIPIQKALQGHPEAPRLWHQHIHNILIKEEGFKCCTHEPCLYFKRHDEELTTTVLYPSFDKSMISPSLEAHPKNAIKFNRPFKNRWRMNFTISALSNVSMALTSTKPETTSRYPVKHR